VESKFVDLGSMRLHYGEGAPNGPKLVFLTGFPETWDRWSSVHEILEPRYHLFSPTYRGMGQSGRANAYPIAPYIEDVRAFLREVVAGPAFGLGHSAGAWFGLAAAGQDPTAFAGFVSVDQPLDPRAHVRFYGNRTATIVAMTRAMREAKSATQLASLLATVPASAGGVLGDHLRPSELAEEASSLRRFDPEIFGPWADYGLESWIVIHELDAWPGAYRNPLLFVDGEPGAGSMLDAAAIEYNLERYPWAERVELTGQDHSMGLADNPAPVLEHVQQFFRKIH